MISGADAEGRELFRHAYAYLQDVPVTYFGQEMPAALHVYQTADADAGMFTYFAFSDDTLAETQHIEFRYGETLDNMGSYTEGPYAYWLAGAIQDGYSEKLIKACIKLFVDENVGEMFSDQAESTDAVAIDSAEKLAAINENPSGHYILTADIDLAGAEWTPIGAFVMGGGEEGEVPDLTAAFTGTFDGQGHTIRNLAINQPEGWALGLFGCAANAEIGNFTLENAAVDGSVMAADVVGYAYCSTVSGVTLIPQCIGLGQGAGVAAAVCVKDGTTTHNVDIKKVQKILCTEQDVPLPRQENTDPELVRELEEYKYGTYTDAAKKCREKAGLDW